MDTNQKKQQLPFSSLGEWRDKTLLLINSAKKNKEELEKDILEKLGKFVEMYGSLESVLQSYKKLAQLGYFDSFVGPSVLEKKIFAIKNC